MKIPLPNDIFLKTLISEKQLKKKVSDLGVILTEYYKNKTPLFISISNGAMIFTADLIRHVELPLNLDSVKAHSYSGTKSTGKVNFTLSLKFDIKNRDVIIIDDILDSGLTMQKLSEQLSLLSPASLKTCVLLDKPEARKNNLEADFVCFTIPNTFIVGYGLDYNELFRNLPYIAELEIKN